jgi:hypothetical protein
MKQGARMKMFIELREAVDRMFHTLFRTLTEHEANAHIVRFAITFLDLWQAIIILNRNYWIPDLVAPEVPLFYYTIYAVFLAVSAMAALILHTEYWLSAIVFGLNVLTYLFIGISALWYSDPPKASLGFSFFVMLIALSAFWRKILLMIRKRSIRKRN